MRPFWSSWRSSRSCKDDPFLVSQKRHLIRGSISGLVIHSSGQYLEAQWKSSEWIWAVLMEGLVHLPTSIILPSTRGFYVRQVGLLSLDMMVLCEERNATSPVMLCDCERYFTRIIFLISEGDMSKGSEGVINPSSSPTLREFQRMIGHFYGILDWKSCMQHRQQRIRGYSECDSPRVRECECQVRNQSAIKLLHQKVGGKVVVTSMNRLGIESQVWSSHRFIVTFRRFIH